MAFSLEGIKVVQTTEFIAGPMATRLLSDWGADVVHVENPVRGRRGGWTQQVQRGGGRHIMSDINYAAQNHHRNKRSIAIDLSQEEGREIIYRLLEKADVFMSNFRPREQKKFGLEYETLSKLNPRLIQANLTGYGQKGPDRDLPGFEQTGYFARSGMLHVLQVPGSHPPQTPMGSGDNVVSLCLALGIMTALFMRGISGVGQEVDVSLFSAGVYALSYDIAGALVTGQDRQQLARRDINNVLINSYQTKDGRWLRLSIAAPELYWSRLCQVIEREDVEHDPRFATFEPRIENHAILFDILEEAFLSKTLDEWKVRLNEAGLPWALIQNLPEVISDPQARANDFFVPLEHPTYGRIEVVANPIKLSKAPANVVKPAPELGQHTEEILLENGYTREDIARFREQGVIA